MWLSFLACAVACVFILYVPGYFIARLFRFGPLISTACAPLFTLGVLGLLTAIYGLADLFCTWLNVLAPLVLIPLALFVFSKLVIGRWRKTDAALPRDWLILAAYLIVGIGVCAYAFIAPLDGPASYHATYDCVTHFSVLRVMQETGAWSALNVSSYADVAASGSGSFYPNLWHQVVLLVYGIVSPPEMTISINACTAIMMGVVFPTSSYVFLRSLFPEKWQVVALGSIATMSFGIFPWLMAFDGVLYANLLANALLLGFLGCVIGSLGQLHENRKSSIIALAAAFLIGGVSLALSQTNAIFTAFVFLVPYISGYCYRLLKEQMPRYAARTWFAPVFFAGVSLLVAVIWLAMYSAPMLSSVVHYENIHIPRVGIANTFYGAASFAFDIIGNQWLLSFVSLIGLLTVVLYRRFFLVVPPLYMMAAYVVTRNIKGQFKMLLAGFWYNDSRRMACNAALFLIPVVAVGLWVLISLASRLVKKLVRMSSVPALSPKAASRLVASVILSLFCIVNFYPTYRVPPTFTKYITCFGEVRQRMEDAYTMEESKVYSPEERSFVKKAVELLPEGAKVINQPHDGSSFAYGLDGLNTYFRSTSIDDCTDEGNIIRTRIADIATDSEVQEAVADVGAEYILLLDQGGRKKGGTWLSNYTYTTAKQWASMNGITDDTPGLELLLSEGDMRLYKINVGGND